MGRNVKKAGTSNVSSDSSRIAAAARAAAAKGRSSVDERRGGDSLDLHPKELSTASHAASPVVKATDKDYLSFSNDSDPVDDDNDIKCINIHEGEGEGKPCCEQQQQQQQQQQQKLHDSVAHKDVNCISGDKAVLPRKKKRKSDLADVHNSPPPEMNLMTGMEYRIRGDTVYNPFVQRSVHFSAVVSLCGAFSYLGLSNVGHSIVAHLLSLRGTIDFLNVGTNTINGFIKPFCLVLKSCPSGFSRVLTNIIFQ